MYQKDYILRMIEMMVELIASFLKLLRKGEIGEASKLIEFAYRDYLKNDAAFFVAIPTEKLTDVLLHEHNYTHGHLEILAELFYAEGEMLFESSNKLKSIDYYRKSILLTEFVLKESGTYSVDKEERINLLKQRILELQAN